MNTGNDHIAALITGPSYPFSQDLHESLPLATPGVYTIWKNAEFLYVGVAGRRLDASVRHMKMKGLRDRLDSHWKGRRAGDQFCVYVCDRLILPNLSSDEIRKVAEGELQLDTVTRPYIQAHLAYRWLVTSSYSEALAIERQFARGETLAGLPLLNPTRKRHA